MKESNDMSGQAHGGRKRTFSAAFFKSSINNLYSRAGMPEHCILALLHTRDCYGYESAELLSRHINIADGTVYPILRRLKADGRLATYLQEESGGPPRKYCTLTVPGRKAYQSGRAECLKFAQSVKTLVEDPDDDKE